MNFDDEKDYMMRIIKDMVKILCSLMLGKQCTSVELPEENKYEVSGRTLEEYERMMDQGLVNEAENQILESIDYRQKEDVLAAALFYQYLSEKDEEFLIKHNYSKKEVLDGIQNVMEHAGYGSIMDILLKD
jgi:hypothetical protein